MSNSRCTLLPCLVLAVVGCVAGEEAAAEPCRVWVSILPQAQITERIGGEHVQVRVLVGPGQSPATFDPTPQQMAELQHAELLVRIGVPFESRLLPRLRSLMPDLRVVDGREGIELVAGTYHHGHDHGAADPHFWLDPTLMAVHAETICTALTELRPALGATFRTRTDTLVADLHGLDRRLAEQLARHRGRTVFAFHPAYSYLARRYGLQVMAAESEGKEPGPREVARLIDAARVAGVRTVFVQPQFSVRTADALAEAIDGRVVDLDPLAADYLGNLEVMGRAIAAALSDGAAGGTR